VPGALQFIDSNKKKLKKKRVAAGKLSELMKKLLDVDL